MQWFNPNNQSPIIPTGPSDLTSEAVLFACDNGKVYGGYYHRNGVFYDFGNRIAAFTEAAKWKWGHTDVVMVQWWAEYPAHPGKKEMA